MPTIIIQGFKFRFYSSDRNEPPHVHVIKDEKVVKYGCMILGWSIIEVTTNLH